MMQAVPPEKLQELKAVYSQTGDKDLAAKTVGIPRAQARSVLSGDIGYAPHRDDSLAACHPEPPLPMPAPEAGGAQFPDPISLSYETFDIDTSGTWLVLNDVHIPYHDRRTIEAAVKEAQARGVVGVLLNGDIMDCASVSSHYREPNETRFDEEVEAASQFLAWLRFKLPKARVVWKEGNHEWRLRRYIVEHAQELANIKALTIPKLTDAEQYGVEWIADKRVINVGKLAVVHGHEFRGGGGVNPARWLFLRTVSTAMCGHFHRTSEHHEQGLDRRLHGVWSVGCACFLYPSYDPLNKWNNGWAFIELGNDKRFTVNNRRMLRDGTVC